MGRGALVDPKSIRVVVRLHPESAVELTEAIDFYEGRAIGLGHEFLNEIERLLGEVSSNPKAGAEFDPPFRRVLCRRFPFSVVYREVGEGVRVLAVMHQRRRPGYWRDRA